MAGAKRVLGAADLASGCRLDNLRPASRTSYGMTVAADMARAVARAGLTPVTGGGFGIDAAVIRACLNEEVPTVVVSSTGLTRPHPNAHAELFDQVVEQGGVIVSAYGPDTCSSRSTASERAATMAELATHGTVIVEAGIRSGTRATATRARAMGRRLYAVPGPITSAASQAATISSAKAWPRLCPRRSG